MAPKGLYAIGLVLSAAASVRGQSPQFGQCGGIGWTGPTTCVAGSVCTVSSPYYSQCLPGTATSTATGPVTTPTISPVSGNKLKYAGVNIAGFDFGCGSDGTCNVSGAWPPLTQYYGMDGAGQMQHFTQDDGFNVFRLPVGWQFLVNGVLGGDLDPTTFPEYDQLVQTCLDTGAACIVDIHNYARWNGLIIGQGGPTNEQFASVWSQLATKYADEENIIFGVMNEPHDVPDIGLWAQSVQAAVTAIRQAGATKQMILLPGNDWTSAQTFVSDGSGPALLNVTNPDGTTTGLIFDVHKYLDVDNSGTNTECVTNNIDSSWAPLATWLRENGRQAFNTETGGGNVASCVEFMCQQIAFQAQNSDVFLGYVGWAAGNFATGYPLAETPTQTGTTWTDPLLVSSCMAPIAGAQSGSTGQ
ncbi:glycoside hydrolase family 5 protein [Collybiopsis luxurians FD-317 M1]|uniref:cellulase n=1 Tax=Collybiopsis luxurians FD-317 M1 TaxID=944289 RepID=A0A0D0CAM0_9AGAR|nr:glycoside hydrolase family 5 protein [Collybiopsis luxurians FD-317 M1]